MSDDPEIDDHSARVLAGCIVTLVVGIVGFTLIVVHDWFMDAYGGAVVPLVIDAVSLVAFFAGAVLAIYLTGYLAIEGYSGVQRWRQ